jgi:hypothetical protein
LPTKSPSTKPDGDEAPIDPSLSLADARARARAIDSLEDESSTSNEIAPRPLLAEGPPWLTLAATFPPAPEAPTQAVTTRAAEVQALASALVERAAFWGDGSSGGARLRFGPNAKGGLAGATVILEHAGGRLRMRVEGADESALAARLGDAGISVE